jgi:predicted NBD/HSP70 family sugar kinase
LTKDLLRDENIVEAGLSDNCTGRKQILLRFNPRAASVIALDFDTERVLGASLDLAPVIKGHVFRERTVLDRGAEGLLEQLVSCARKIIRSQSHHLGPIIGIGIGDPGLVNTKDGVSVVSSTIDFWKNIPVRERFERELGYPCMVLSNTRAKTIAERTMGAGQNAEDMIFIEYGVGIGCGIVSGGRVIEGSTWAAGEFGHTHLSDNGPACKCGSFGCLEAIAGLGSLELRARRAVVEGASSLCVSLASGNPDDISGWHVLEAAAREDKLCSRLVDDVIGTLGLGIANLVNLFNPSLIVLDARLERAGEVVLSRITRVVRRQALAASSEHVQFRFAKLGPEAALIGAAVAVLNRYFEIPVFQPPKIMMDGSMQARGAAQNRRRMQGPPEPETAGRD